MLQETRESATQDSFIHAKKDTCVGLRGGNETLST